MYSLLGRCYSPAGNINGRYAQPVVQLLDSEAQSHCQLLTESEDTVTLSLSDLQAELALPHEVEAAADPLNQHSLPVGDPDLLQI